MRALSTIAMLVVVAAVAVLGTTDRAAAVDGRLTVQSLALNVGEEGSVVLHAGEISEPGVGTWTLDVTYDPNLLILTDCVPEEHSVCVPDLAPDTVRITGATAVGLYPDVTLALFTFRCQAIGVSPLTIGVEIWTDAGAPPPPPSVEVEDGSVTCVAPGADA
ncbi:MAG: hypothetical protein U1B78_04020, partial [Dehalococcoidia bacterium]|nr:hypothetical protein [Dehalococcoidia bacterium]